MKSPIKHLILSAVLFLPLCFFIWFYASTLLVLPVKYMVQAVLQWWQPDLFDQITQKQYLLVVQTWIESSQGVKDDGTAGFINIDVNPMLYGYGLAVISGLVVSVPDLTVVKRVLQILIGYVVVVLLQAFGSFWQAVKILLFSAGSDAQQAILSTGIEPELVAGLYQLSYLILPAVIPVVTWILMNRQFISALTHFRQQEHQREQQSNFAEEKRS